MFKTPIIITLVMLSVIIATLSNGIIAAACSLFAFSLLFYLVSTEKKHKSHRD
ncbi:hypothetical protein [Psychromonas algicola]|uniref:hypothetical protein n=1 Tax=Psychromonas algicola TaxID=2555642 RepID=UPI0014198F59|nr:hypothetical protein [Psychromonas sp. RZ5]